MQKVFNILKIFAVLACLTAAYFAYTFWSIWQKNDQAEISSLNLSANEVAMGNTFEISASFKVPWHREMNIENFVSLPEGLRLIPDSLKVERQKLKVSGYRIWNAQLTAIALNDGNYSEKPVEFRMQSDRFKKQTSLKYPLPKFLVSAPTLERNHLKEGNGKLDDSILSQPIAASTATPTQISSNNYLLYLILSIVILLGIYFFIKPSHILPPWEEAYERLSKLTSQPPENFEKFFLSLTDILKTYSERRFSFNATACSSQEFVSKLDKQRELAKEQLKELEALLQKADSVKFGGNRANSSVIEDSISRVRHFINSTKPADEVKK